MSRAFWIALSAAYLLGVCGWPSIFGTWMIASRRHRGIEEGQRRWLQNDAADAMSPPMMRLVWPVTFAVVMTYCLWRGLVMTATGALNAPAGIGGWAMSGHRKWSEIRKSRDQRALPAVPAAELTAPLPAITEEWMGWEPARRHRIAEAVRGGEPAWKVARREKTTTQTIHAVVANHAESTP